MGAFPGNDLIRMGSLWAVLLFWAAPEKFLPWLDVESGEEAAVSRAAPAEESGDSRPGELKLALPDLVPPRTDRPSPGPRVEHAAVQPSEREAAGGDGGRRTPCSDGAGFPADAAASLLRPVSVGVPAAPCVARIATAMLTALSETGPPRI